MAHHLIAIVAVLIIPLVSSDDCYYAKFDPEHTACKTRFRPCMILNSTVTDDEKNLVVSLHNQYREKVAVGNETQAGGLPSASNMREMFWDDELAMIAEKLAMDCDFRHDYAQRRQVDRFEVGQNIYESSSRKYELSSDVWVAMVNSFYSQVKDFDQKYISSYEFNPKIAEFSQVIWADSWRLGCGKVIYKKSGWYSTFIVCNYGPIGNVIGASIYEIGDTASDCPSNSADSSYLGLCGET